MTQKGPISFLRSQFGGNLLSPYVGGSVPKESESRTLHPSIKMAAAQLRGPLPSTLALSMSCHRKATLSMQVFAAYCGLMGVLIICAPKFLCDTVDTVTFGILGDLEMKPDELSSQYGSIAGFFYGYLGFVYMSLAGSDEFQRFSVIGRMLGVVGGFTILVLMGKVPVKLYAFPAVDVVFAIWTKVCLRPLDKKDR